MIIKRFKDFTVNVLAGANVVTVILMLFIGFSDHINPISHPYIGSIGLIFPLFLILNLGLLFFWLIVKWRMSLIPIIGFVVGYIPIRTYIPINPSSNPPTDAIKVLSYNVHCYSGMHGDDDKQKTFREIFNYFKESKADIVCLQEDLYPGNVSEAFIDSLFAYKHIAMVGTKKQNAVGVYTHYPIIHVDTIAYPSEGNGSIACFLKIKQDTVIVINNHFESTHLSPDERQHYKEMLKGEMNRNSAKTESRRLFHRLSESVKLRAPQADIVHHYIEEHNKYPIILCGDFNDSPISYTHRIVNKALIDCYVETGQGIGLSYNQKGFFVRIDNIMCSNYFQPYNCKVDNKIETSDHYPIICWLKKLDNPKK